MFGGAHPNPADHPDMMRSARQAFAVLRHGLDRRFAARGAHLAPPALELEALFAWSSLHGVVSLLRSDALDTLDLAPETRPRLAMHVLERIGAALGVAPQADGAAMTYKATT